MASTWLGQDLAAGAYWRDVFRFLVRVSDQLAPTDLEPLLDFLQMAGQDRGDGRARAADGRLGPDPDGSRRNPVHPFASRRPDRTMPA